LPSKFLVRVDNRYVFNSINLYLVVMMLFADQMRVSP